MSSCLRIGDALDMQEKVNRLPRVVSDIVCDVAHPDYTDTFLKNGFGLRLRTPIHHEILSQYINARSAIRKALKILCNTYSVVDAPTGNIPTLAQGQLVSRISSQQWHVDRNVCNDEYYTFLHPHFSTTSCTRFCPIAHLLDVMSQYKAVFDISCTPHNMSALIADTPVIKTMLNECNVFLSTGSEESDQLSRQIDENVICMGGSRRWVMFSDHPLAHDSCENDGNEKILTYDIAHVPSLGWYTVYS